jgi:tetratricopeptide (TPR) repeat protein
MTQAESPESTTKGKGKAFFDRAEQVAETGNWDFAIEMYLEGIQREPDSVDRGHKRLHEVALKRKAQGGKGPGVMDHVKRRPGKDPVMNLVHASYFLAKDPGSVQYMAQVLRAAQKLDLPEVVHWIAEILLQSQRQAKKPNKRILLETTKAFESVEDYSLAVQAAEMALQQAPDDGELRGILRDLSAQYTIQKGKYTEEGDFTKGVKDMEKQQELMREEAMVKDEEYLQEQVRRTRQEYLASPKVAGKITAVVDALLQFENEAHENEAIDILTKAHKDTSAYQFKMRVGDIRIRQMTRRYRYLRDEGDMGAAAEHARRQLAFELAEYTERAANYPTDLSIKFELGRRQFLTGMYDEAISALQQAERDPRRALRARSLIGQAFTKKGWFREAAETFERSLQVEMTEEHAKELRYYLADVYDKTGELDKAQKQFSMVVQMDYNYKNARHRLEEVRTKLQSQQAAAEGEAAASDDEQ